MITTTKTKKKYVKDFHGLLTNKGRTANAVA
jgi:hypothetical protein